MNKLYFVLICSVILYSCAYQKEAKVREVKSPINQVEQIKDSPKNSKEIDGVFEFVSETTSFTGPVKRKDNKEPVKKTYKKTNKEWKGLWIFKKGYFSRSMERDSRWHPGSFPSNSKELGFNAVAGKFHIDDKGVIHIRKTLTLYPAEIFTTESLHYEFKGDLLILKQSQYPEGHLYRYAVNKWKRVTVLRRLVKETGSRN